jgi:hypothetical protein
MDKKMVDKLAEERRPKIARNYKPIGEKRGRGGGGLNLKPVKVSNSQNQTAKKKKKTLFQVEFFCVLTLCSAAI